MIFLMYTGQCVIYIFIKVLEIMFSSISEKCQKLMQTAKTFSAPDITYIMISDFLSNFEPFRLLLSKSRHPYW